MFVLLLLLSNISFAAPAEVFYGEAKEDGITVYTEEHRVTFDPDGTAIEAITDYRDTSNKIIATLKSDFRQSLNLPDHIFTDLRSGNQYGVRRTGSKVYLFNKNSGENEETKELKDDSGQESLQIGCQGFNYYLKGKIDYLKKIKSIPVLFMVPGDLTTYNFVLDFLEEDKNSVSSFTVKIENWFLRAFAPKLEFKYDRKINRIVWYRGISNIKSNLGKVMNVTIDYKYFDARDK